MTNEAKKFILAQDQAAMRIRWAKLRKPVLKKLTPEEGQALFKRYLNGGALGKPEIADLKRYLNRSRLEDTCWRWALTYAQIKALLCEDYVTVEDIFEQLVSSEIADETLAWQEAQRECEERKQQRRVEWMKEHVVTGKHNTELPVSLEGLLRRLQRSETNR